MAKIPTKIEDAVWRARELIHDTFAEEGFPPVQASAHDLVTVTVDARCRLTAVSLYGASLEGKERERLEAAIVAAVSDGVKQVVQRQAERIAGAIKGASAS